MPKTTSKSTRRTPSRKSAVDTTTMNAPMTYPQQSNGLNPLVVFIMVALAFAAGYFFFKSSSLEKAAATQPTNQAAAGDQTPNVKATKPSNSDHWRGNKNARYVMIEYSDLECPFCKQVHPTMLKVMETYQDKVAWVYRHFPLSFHPKAQKSAEAVECAWDQEQDAGFFKLVDAVYDKMPTLEVAGIPDLATSLGLDGGQIKNCMDSATNEKKVKAQQQEGGQAGVRATPTVVLYDTKTGKTETIEGAVPFDSFKASLDAFMK